MPPDELIGAATLRSAQNGDSRAIEEIFERYKGVVRAKSRSYFLVGADHEDLIQEGMIGLHKAIRDYKADKNTSFSAFAGMCITRQIITAIKSATRLKHIPLNSYLPMSSSSSGGDAQGRSADESPPEATAPAEAAFFADPEEIVISREQKVFFESRVIELLSAFERSVLARFLNGETYNGIAEAEGRDVKSIDNALQRVKKKLTRYLEDRDRE